MIVRILEDNEKYKIRTLYEEIFDDTKEFVDYYFSSYIKNTVNFVCEENNKIIGMATVHPKKLMVSEKLCTAGYIYGVATAPKHRGKGVMKKVLDAINKYAFENCYDYLYLIPVNPAIYVGQGFKLVKEKKDIIYTADMKCDNNSSDIDIMKVSENNIGKCTEYARNFYKNKVSILCDKEYILENLQRLSIKNSGIYCIFHKVCDRILGLAFVEDDEEVVVTNLICDESDIKLCMESLLNRFDKDKITYKIHDVMFKEVHKEMNIICEYSININDEV